MSERGPAEPAAGSASSTAHHDARPPLSVRLGRRRSAGGMSLNLTPMIDVVFLLLFFFLAVTRFGSMEGLLPARLPGRTAAAPMEIPRTPLRVRFLWDAAAPDGCRVTIDRLREDRLAIATLAATLADVRRNQPGFDDADTPVHLLAGDDVPWDHVANAYNAGLAAGYQRIYFIDTP